MPQRINPVLRARNVLNGKNQRGLYSKEEVASPAVALDSFFLMSLVDVAPNVDSQETLNQRMEIYHYKSS